MDRTEANSGTRDVPERLRFDVAALEAWMRANVAGFAGPLNVSQFKGGQSNPTYRLDTPSGRAFVLRRKPPGKLLPGAHAVEREARVMSALGSTGFPVPHIHGLCEDESVIGTPFFVMDMVEGRIIWEADFPGPDPDRPRRPLRRDERDHRRAAQRRPATRSASPIMAARPASSNARSRAGRSNISPTPTPGAFRRWTRWSTGSASICPPTAATRASSMATFAATI